MAYRYGNRAQMTLLPPAIENYVGEDDPVRAYDAIIDRLDIEELGFKLDSNAVGNSSYYPITMLKILVYAYSYGIRSSRKIERALHHNLSFIWLAGGLKPDHKTISTYRKDNKVILKNVLKSCARICLELGLIQGNTLFVDGSKFRSNAGNRETKSKESWEKNKAQVLNQINEIIEECQQIDDAESGSLVELQKELKSKEKRYEKIDAIIKSFNGEKSINGTDKDCKIMRGRQGSHAGYSGQLTVDEQHGLIVSLDAVQDVTDYKQLNKQIENAERNLGITCDTVCADSGYASINELKPLFDKGKEVVVPSTSQVEKEKEDPFSKAYFKYDREKDEYTCPEGHQLYRSYQATGTNKVTYRMKQEKNCSSCINFGICTSAKRGRSITRLVNEDLLEQQRKNYEAKENQEIYKKRKMLVEHPFGHIKRNLGAGSFLMRGIEGVKAELSILGTCFNIARLITLFGGVKPMVHKLQ